MRRLVRVADILAVALVTWGGLSLVPVEWVWFDPGRVIVGDSTVDDPPVMQFNRKVKRQAKISYQVVIRNVTNRQVVCDPKRGPFTYRPTASLPADMRLDWWTGYDPRCWPREVGTYFMETCWTVVRPFWGLVTPKTVCRESNTFRIAAVAPDEAEDAVEATRSLKLQVDELQDAIRDIQRQTIEE